MIPKTLDELAAMLDLLRAKHVAHLEIGDLKIVLGGEEDEEGDTASDQPAPPERSAPEETVNEATGLTKSQEDDLFYSS